MYFLKIDVQYLEKLNELYNDSLFSPGRMKSEKFKKLVTKLHDETEYGIHIRSLKQELDHGLLLKKVCSVIKFNQKPWLHPYIDINTKLKQNAKTNIEKYFFKLMNNAVFRKTMENLRKSRNIKLVKTERRRNYLIAQPNDCTTKFFTETLLAIEIKKQYQI